jgi:hypothetical protein
VERKKTFLLKEMTVPQIRVIGADIRNATCDEISVCIIIKLLIITMSSKQPKTMKLKPTILGTSFEIELYVAMITPLVKANSPQATS